MQTLQRAVNMQSLIRKVSEPKLTASVSLLVTPPLAITVLSVTTAILTGMFNARLNFQDKSTVISREIDR